MSELPLDFAGREAVVVALDVVARELEPPAASFFRLAPDGTVDCWVFHGPRAAVETWQAARHDDDVRLLLRDGQRLIGGITLWRPSDHPGWTPAQLRLLGALGALIELAYVSELRAAAQIDAHLPPALTRRERQVARLLAGGATNAEVGRALYVSPDTAKSHTRAVLAKLHVASRRELAVRLTRGSSAAADVEPPRAPSFAAGGDATPRRLLAFVLEWAAPRLGAAVGGCALFSARTELVAQAWGVARGKALDPVHAYAVHRHLFPASEPSDVVRAGVADPAGAPVRQLETGVPLGALLAELGLATPLSIVLRAEGRVAGLIWLAGPIDQRRGAQALRGLQPLLELAYAAPLRAAREAAASAGDFAGRGLTRRELTVARLALAGHGNAAIAAELGISESTVRNHMTQILAKCGVRTRTQLIALFRR